MDVRCTLDSGYIIDLGWELASTSVSRAVSSVAELLVTLSQVTAYLLTIGSGKSAVTVRHFPLLHSLWGKSAKFELRVCSHPKILELRLHWADTEWPRRFMTSDSTRWAFRGISGRIFPQNCTCTERLFYSDTENLNEWKSIFVPNLKPATASVALDF